MAGNRCYNNRRRHRGSKLIGPGSTTVKKRVLVVLNYYYPYISGLSEYARMVNEYLSAEFDITVLTGRHDPSLQECETMRNVKVIRAKPLFPLHKGYISYDFILKYRTLSRQTDLIHLHLPMFESGLLSVISPRSKPILATYQCDVHGEGGLVDIIAAAVTKLSCRIALKRSAKITVLSNDYAAGSPVLKGLENKWVEIYPPIKEIQCADNRQRGKGVAIGFIGRFVGEKGIDVLLNAIPAVLGKYPEARFLLAGDIDKVAGGSVYAQIQPKLEQLRSSIVVLGRIDESALSGFYCGLDVFVLPSVNSYEAFGMVQVEAMKAGNLVVSTDMRGVRIPVQLTGNGEVVKPGDPVELANAIIRCLERLRIIQREDVVKKTNMVFSNERTYHQYAELYNSLIK